MRPLRLLIVDASAADAELLIDAIRRAGLPIVWERVDDHATLMAALAAKAWDVVVCAARLLRIAADQAVRLVRAHAPAALVLAMSDWEADAATLREAGASAFMTKADYRLVPAVLAKYLNKTAG